MKIIYIILLILFICIILSLNNEKYTSTDFYLNNIVSNNYYYKLTNTESRVYYSDSSSNIIDISSSVLRIASDISSNMYLFKNSYNFKYKDVIYTDLNLNLYKNIFFAIPINNIVNPSTQTFIMEFVIEIKADTSGNIISFMNGSNPYKNTLETIQIADSPDGWKIILINNSPFYLVENLGTNMSYFVYLCIFYNSNGTSWYYVVTPDMNEGSSGNIYIPKTTLYIGLNTPYVRNNYMYGQGNITLHSFTISPKNSQIDVLINNSSQFDITNTDLSLDYTESFLVFINLIIPIIQTKTIIQPEIIEKTIIQPEYIDRVKTIIQPEYIDRVQTIIQPEYIDRVRTIIQPEYIDRVKTIIQPEYIDRVKTIIQPEYIEKKCGSEIIEKIIIKPEYIDRPITTSGSSINNDNNNSNDNTIYYILITIIVILIVTMIIIIIKKRNNNNNTN